MNRFVRRRYENSGERNAAREAAAVCRCDEKGPETPTISHTAKT